MYQKPVSKSKIFFKKMATLLPPVRDRWTPLYFEHGRMEQEGYSIKFVHADGDIETVPVAQISCIMMGPGTTVTHQAIVACSRTKTPVVWVGEDSLMFYASGVEVNEKCHTAARQAELFADPASRLRVAQGMFKSRFGEEVDTASMSELRGKEGIRVRDLYGRLSEENKIAWNGRDCSGKRSGGIPDDLNRMLNASNRWLYALCLSVITTMGYIPSLGFVHVDGKIPFVYDIADLYKEDITIGTCFEVYGETHMEDLVTLKQRLVQKVVQRKLLREIPLDLKRLVS